MDRGNAAREASFRNVDASVVKGFGEEWTAFDQSRLPAEDSPSSVPVASSRESGLKAK